MTANCRYVIYVRHVDASQMHLMSHIQTHVGQMHMWLLDPIHEHLQKLTQKGREKKVD